MKTNHVESQFTAMGARFRARIEAHQEWGPTGYAVDIQRDRHGEFFELRVPERLHDRLDVSVLQTLPHDRHLLLLIRQDEPTPTLNRFLCGHDERAWFVAAVPERVSSVTHAMEALKPAEVQLAQDRAGLTARERNSRKNRAFRRQGEWFFVPAEWLQPAPGLVLRNEPIRRGRGKPHFVGELYREGGQEVYVCHQYPNGVSAEEYRRLLRSDPTRARWSWRRMQRDAAVFARGDIRHPDHRTITLSDWHRVLMNTESRAPGMPQVAFLD